MSHSPRDPVQDANHPATRKLPRLLSRRDLVLLIVGGIIGSGIFLTPGLALKELHYSVPLFMAAWVLGGLLALMGGLTYAEMAGYKAAPGGVYRFLHDCYGPLVAFLYGWKYFFVGMSSVAALSLAVAGMLGEVLHTTLAVPPLGKWGTTALAVVIIAGLAGTSIRSTRRGANIQNVSSYLKVGALVLMAAVLLALGRQIGLEPPPEAREEAPRAGLPLISTFGLAMLPVIFSYSGWQRPTFVAGEVVDAQRNFPRGMLISLLIVIGVYLLVNLGYLAALGPVGVVEAHETRTVAPAALAAVLGSWVTVPVTLLIVISILGAVNARVMTAPRVYFALARDGLFFRKLAEVHPKWETPAFAILTGACLAVFFATFAEFDQIVRYITFGNWIFHTLTGTTVFIYRRRMTEAERARFRVPGYPWTPLIFIACAAFIVLNTLFANWEEARFGLLSFVGAVPIYYLWRAFSRPREAR